MHAQTRFIESSSGNLSFDTKKKKDDEEAGSGDDKAAVDAPISGPAKLTFPIPGSADPPDCAPGFKFLMLVHV